MAKSLTLALNIGAPDAQRLGLKKTLAGETVSVEKDAADELLRRGWATEPDSDRLAPEATPTSSATPKVGEADKREGQPADGPPDFEGMTKAELIEYADAHKITGVSAAAAKDDILKVVKKAAGPR
jgi:hypothetical protein